MPEDAEFCSDGYRPEQFHFRHLRHLPQGKHQTVVLEDVDHQLEKAEIFRQGKFGKTKAQDTVKEERLEWL